MDMYTLLYLTWITNKDLLCGTESSSQYSVMAYIGKESLKKKKVDICVCTTDSFCCTPETNTTLLINCSNIKQKCKPEIITAF